MNICAEQHDEVCYDGRSCPVCDRSAPSLSKKSKLYKPKNQR